jgi:hypothetical protein
MERKNTTQQRSSKQRHKRRTGKDSSLVITMAFQLYYNRFVIKAATWYQKTLAVELNKMGTYVV